MKKFLNLIVIALFSMFSLTCCDKEEIDEPHNYLTVTRIEYYKIDVPQSIAECYSDELPIMTITSTTKVDARAIQYLNYINGEYNKITKTYDSVNEFDMQVLNCHCVNQIQSSGGYDFYVKYSQSETFVALNQNNDIVKSTELNWVQNEITFNSVDPTLGAKLYDLEGREIHGIVDSGNTELQNFEKEVRKNPTPYKNCMIGFEYNITK